MKVQELLTNINNGDFNLEANLQVKKYLPIELKKTIAQGIIFDCTDDSEGMVKVDSVQKYMSYVKYMITYHTNLEYTDEDYDVLCSAEYLDGNLLDAIMYCFENDATECQRILDLMMNDYLHNNTIEGAVITLFNELTISMNRITTVLNDKINNFDLKSMLPENLDMKQVAEFLEKYNV